MPRKILIDTDTGIDDAVAILLALRLAPHIAGLVNEVVMMGGSIYTMGNITPAAEASIHADPHAASDLMWRSQPVYVEISGLCRDQTIPDPRRQWGDCPTTRVCMDVDAPGVLDLIKERFSS
jgi:inosine-uridine nucleoside N-ribohydrolase